MAHPALDTEPRLICGGGPDPDNLIFLSDGRSGPEVMDSFREKSYRLTAHAEHILRAPGYTSVPGLRYRPTLIRPRDLSGRICSEDSVRVSARERGFVKPPPDVAVRYFEEVPHQPLRQFCSGKVVVMHEPILDIQGDSSLLVLNSHGELDGEVIYSRLLWTLPTTAYLFLDPKP